MPLTLPSLRRTVVGIFVLVAAFAAFNCRDSSESSQVVVVYTALDRGFSEPIFDEFEKATGIEVLPVFDTEAQKSVGLTNRIRGERDHPRCDVFWNNEIVNTIRLQREGLLEAFQLSNAEKLPAHYRDPGGFWYGFAARARVLIVNTELVSEDQMPKSVRDLADQRYRGKTAIAKPLFGTTASHIACLWASDGEESTRAFLDALKANDIQIHGGNKGVAIAVASGAAAFGLTDTDDAMIEAEAGKPVRIVYPDTHSPDAPGTLFLPNVLSLTRGAPNREAALKLIEHLISPEVEARLAKGPSAQIPIHADSAPSTRVKSPREVKSFRVDFSKAAEAFDAARDLVERNFLR